MISQHVSESFNQWLSDHQMKVEYLTDRIFKYLDKHYLIVENKYFTDGKKVTGEEYLSSKDKDKYCKIISISDNGFEINLTIEDDWIELDRCNEVIDYKLKDEDLIIVFQFGTRWYFTEDAIFFALNQFKEFDNGFENESNIIFPYLGVHGAFDLYNGSGSYYSWVHKASFLGVKTLGICEDNTLAGTLAFQAACEKKNIKSIIGETITVQSPDRGKYQIKLYVINDAGWKELLRINSIINVQNEGYIDEVDLLKNKTSNLICVVNPELEIERCILAYKNAFKRLYYQIDFVEWDSQAKEESWLLSLKNYFDNFIKKVPPVLISDSYYLDACDFHIRKSLNTIGRAGFKSQSKNQYFKSFDNILEQANKLFKPEDDRMNSILEQALDSLAVIEEQVQFKIPTGYFRLPQYEMTEEEKTKYTDIDELFWDLIEKGLEERIIRKGINPQIYLERIEKETDVIIRGGYISYFLALADLINFCKREDIWVGVGRGSAAGCLISYLLGIVNLDPIHYNLLFERFLNEGRLGKSLPDIDTDFQGERRDEVKRYLEERYGMEYVTSIGTYGTFKIKAGIKALAREFGVDHQKTNFITQDINAEDSLEQLFYATAKISTKEYVQKYWKVIDKLPLILDQPNNASMHAAGVVIVPKELGSIFEQIPVKKIDGVLVSEWEGEYIDKAGFLKMDILGIKQLDKFAAISKLIKQLKGITVTLNDINLDEQGVYDYFREGFTEDVFQFGAAGLKKYCKKLQPDNIEDLIATVALYRPGPIETGMHNQYISVKNGLVPLVFDKGTEEITAPTYGQIIYQEQIMQVFTHVGGFSLVEADDMRKSISKTTISRAERLASLQGFVNRFYSQGEERGYTPAELEVLWNKIEKFATYSFNRSHAACYAVTGYYCQWFKYKYPLEFWTISLSYTDKDEKIGDRLSEIAKMSGSGIKVAPTDINKSTLGFTPDPKTNTIYWSIDSVKWVGEKAVKEILIEREKNGLFFSIEDFCDRLKGKAVNKRSIVNLIFAGAFDEVEKVSPEQRFKLLEKYFKFSKSKISEELEETKYFQSHEWTLKQRELTGMGIIDFEAMIRTSSVFKSQVKHYKSFTEIQASSDLAKKRVVIAGVITNMVEKPYKDKVRKYIRLDLRDNEDSLSIMVWATEFDLVMEAVKVAGGWENKLIMFSGLVNYYNDTKSLHSFRILDKKGETKEVSQIQIL